MSQYEFPIEFRSDITDDDLDYYVMIEDRLNDLAKRNSDITGAAATLEQPAQGRETPHIFEASIVVYVRPNNVNATEKHEDPELALKGALDAIERQVREQRSKLKEDRGSLVDISIAVSEEDTESE